MDESRNNLICRFEGAFLGAAAADALALPYQHYSRSFLRSIAEPLAREFADPVVGGHLRGQFSDDTQEALAVAASIVEAGQVSGECIASHLVPLWRDHLLIERDPSSAPAMERLASGAADWQHSGLDPGHAEITPASRALAIALWHHTEPSELGRAVVDSTRITHKDPRTLASAAAFAAAVALNVRTEELVLGVFLDAVAGAAREHDSSLAEAILEFPRTLSISENRALRHFESLCPDSEYPPLEDGLGSYAVPAFLTAIYYFLRAPYRYERVVDSCLRAGGQINTPAFLAGAISGALVGEAEIPERLKQGLRMSDTISATARDLFEAWSRRKTP